MQTQRRKAWPTLLGLCFFVAGVAGAQRADLVARVELAPEGIKWVPLRDDRDLTLAVSGPRTDLERTFPAGREPWLAVRDEKYGTLPDGAYSWELRAIPKLDPEERKWLAEAREARDRGREVDLRKIQEKLEGPFIQSGTFSIVKERLVSDREPEPEPERPREREGDLLIEGDLEVRGRKSFAMADPLSASEIVYVALEGPEAGTYFRGAGRTSGGEAVIALPAHFAKVTEAEGLTVQLTPLGDWSRLYVAGATPEELVVRAAEGNQDVEFNFLVQGVRKGYLGYRVDRPSVLEIGEEGR